MQSKSPLVQNWCSWSLEQEAATRHGWHGRQTSFQPPGLFGPFYWCFPQHQLHQHHQRHKSYRKNWLPQVHLIGVIFLTDYANKTGLLVLCATFGSTSQMLCKMSFPSCSDLFAAFFCGGRIPGRVPASLNLPAKLVLKPNSFMHVIDIDGKVQKYGGWISLFSRGKTW